MQCSVVVHMLPPHVADVTSRAWPASTGSDRKSVAATPAGGAATGKATAPPHLPLLLSGRISFRACLQLLNLRVTLRYLFSFHNNSDTKTYIHNLYFINACTHTPYSL
jgi:hypothetical protein